MKTACVEPYQFYHAFAEQKLHLTLRKLVDVWQVQLLSSNELGRLINIMQVHITSIKCLECGWSWISAVFVIDAKACKV